MRVQLPQTAVYWAPSGLDAYGQPTYADPVEIKCRWEDKPQEVIGPQGTKVLSRAMLFVCQDLALAGRLYLGTLEDIDSGDDPVAMGAGEIMSVNKTPSVRGTFYVRTVYL